MRKFVCCFALILCIVLTGCECKHEWTDATCSEPKTCSKCGEVEGEPLEHDWLEATCTESKTCAVCGVTEGEALGHHWNDATCSVPKTCSVCGATDGTPLSHEWAAATCTEAKHCVLCGETDGAPLGHKWDPANCTEPKTCAVCGITDGEPLGHEVTEWETTVEANCLTEGERAGTCNICGRQIKEVLPLTDHTDGEWAVTIEPTEEEPGEWTLYCAVCGEIIRTEEYVLSAAEIEAYFKAKCKSYSYESVARDPIGYKGYNGTFTGKVVQVLEDSILGVTIYNLRINVTKTKYGYEDTLYVFYTQSSDAPRILEDDIVTIWGTFEGTKTYTTVLGASVTIPQFDAKYLTIN